METVYHNQKLDELESWMDHFEDQPGASKIPEWLEALRSLRYDGRLTSPERSPANQLRTQLIQMETERDELNDGISDLKSIMAGYAFAVAFYGDHLLGRCLYTRDTVKAQAAGIELVGESTRDNWICPPDCPVEARDG